MATQARLERTSWRVDAQRNRDLLVAAARKAIAQDGTEVSLRGIAREAGVGLGTLYRHFPTRDALLQELLQSSFDELTERASSLGAAKDPLAALERWMDELAASTAAHPGLAAAVVEKLRDPSSSLHQACVALQRSADALVGSAQRTGSIKPKVGGTDLLSLVVAVAWLCDREGFKPDRRKHLLELVIEGLRT